MTSEATHSKEINETGINKNEPPRFEQDVQEKAHDDGVENKSSTILEKAAHPLVKPQQPSIPFPNRVRKEKEEALQRNFLENLKQFDINISFIEALLQITKYAQYLKSLLKNKSRLEEACIETMNERLSDVLLNELPSKEKDPKNFTIPCQVLEKHKEVEDLVAYHLSRFESQHMEVLTEREIADKFSDEHLMELKSKFKDNEPWYADFEEPYAFKLCADNIIRRCVAGRETLEILAHCHSGPTGGHHSANFTAKKVYESRFYWPSVFKDVNEYAKSLMSEDEILWDHFPTLEENDNDKVNMPSFPSPKPTVSDFNDLDFFKDFKNEFPAIVYNDALMSKLDFLTELAISPQHIDEFNLKDETSFSKCDEEEQNILYFNDLFPFNVIYPDDSKPDKDNDDDKVDIEHSLEDLSVKPLPDVINTDVGAYAHGSNKLLETRPRERNINEYWWRIYKIWRPRSVGVLKPQDGCSTHDLAHKRKLENLPSKNQGSFLF
ncbi:reverse transcriptase domain-containing protein [Tanacetum coccineum]